jgi:hypothetical protein
MLNLTKIADLDVSAASGLVALEDGLYVVMDDEVFVACYGFDGQPRRRGRLFEGKLSEEAAARKREKPDLEALTALPDGRLLALGSGSTAARMRGALIEPAGGFSVRVIDLSPLYEALQTQLPELNIEGAAVHADRLWLAQRGNGAAGINACVELDLDAALASLEHDSAIAASPLLAVHSLALGEIAGVALGLTDLAAHPSAGLLFSAAAEAGGSTYEDGACAGSVVGLLSAACKVRASVGLTPNCKVEGIAVDARFPNTLWLVADPDDRGSQAPLFRAALTLCGFDLAQTQGDQAAQG